ncbi:MAG: SseB family protein [Armatimonadota bacterium]|nr:SseB family protein [Armatimonadota bacterium]
MEEQPHDNTELLDDPTGMGLEGEMDAADGPPPLTAEMIERDLLPENLELFHAILELAQNPQGDRGRLYAALVGGTYLVPLAKAPMPTEGSTEPNEVTLEVLTLTGPNGELALPIFTHEAALAQWTPEPPPTVPLPGGAVFQLSAGSPMEVVAINPAGPFGGQVTRAEFEPLSQGVMPVLVAPQPEEAQNAAQNVYIDVPMTPLPEETMEGLAAMMESNPAIKSAHLFLMQMGDATAPELTLGIHAEGAASQWVEPQVTRLMQQQKLLFDPYDAPRLLLLHAVPGAESVRNSVPPFFLRDDEGEELGEEPEEEATMEAAGDQEASSSSGPDDAPKKRGRWPFGRR